VQISYSLPAAGAQKNNIYCTIHGVCVGLWYSTYQSRTHKGVSHKISLTRSLKTNAYYIFFILLSITYYYNIRLERFRSHVPTNTCIPCTHTTIIHIIINTRVGAAVLPRGVGVELCNTHWYRKLVLDAKCAVSRLPRELATVIQYVYV